MNKTQQHYKRAKELIPGGTQLLSKRPELYLPGSWPAYYKKAEGCRVWDMDDCEYIDMATMGIGCCSLGYADPDVNEAVKAVIDSGNMSTLNPPEEVECAELLIKLHPWSDMARFVRTGGEAMAASVRIARSYSRKDIVMFCGYHGWHDWYISANLSGDSSLNEHLLPGLSPAGVPKFLQGSSIPFLFNDITDFKEQYKACKGRVAAVVLETVRDTPPDIEFVSALRQVCDEESAALIFDEITCGFRLNCGGAHLVYDLEPDIAVFAKGISNGFPMAAVIGKGKVMQAAQDSFISSTYWTERIGSVAAIATIRKMQELSVQDRLISIGTRVQRIWKLAAEAYDIPVHITGIAPLSHLMFSEKPLVYKTLFTQQMLKKGFLAPTGVYASYAHTEGILDLYEDAVMKVFGELQQFRSTGNEEKYLDGAVCQSGFQRLN